MATGCHEHCLRRGGEPNTEGGRRVADDLFEIVHDQRDRATGVHGAAKGAVSIFMQGLRNRLHKAGVSVTTIKPGFVDTPMTADFDKGLLWAQPEAIAKTIFKAAKGHSGDVYAPFFWRPIMGVIRAVPEFLFKRLSL